MSKLEAGPELSHGKFTCDRAPAHAVAEKIVAVGLMTLRYAVALGVKLEPMGRETDAVPTLERLMETI